MIISLPRCYKMHNRPIIHTEEDRVEGLRKVQILMAKQGIRILSKYTWKELKTRPKRIDISLADDMFWYPNESICPGNYYLKIGDRYFKLTVEIDKGK